MNIAVVNGRIFFCDLCISLLLFFPGTLFFEEISFPLSFYILAVLCLYFGLNFFCFILFFAFGFFFLVTFVNMVSAIVFSRVMFCHFEWYFSSVVKFPLSTWSLLFWKATYVQPQTCKMRNAITQDVIKCCWISLK